MKYFIILFVIVAIVVVIYLIVKSNNDKQLAALQQSEFTSILNSNQNQINALNQNHSSGFSQLLAALSLF